MKFMIFTQPDDNHAVIVELALKSLGHDVRLLFSADQPSLLSHSVWINKEHIVWKSSDIKKQLKLGEYDVVWFRRPHKPVIHKHVIHSQDYGFAERENRLFFEGLTSWLSHQAWWVNPFLGARRTNSKLLQLWIARSSGLLIPKTLCSNSPNDIRRFLLSCKGRSAIYKPLCSHFWVESKFMKAAYTAAISMEDLPEDDVLQLTPGLFQERIEKAYELRVTCLGKHCVAVKVDSQSHPLGSVDWRAIPEHELQVSPYTLPQEIMFKLQTLMQKLGIVFGCVDMIVTPKKEYIFLEVNEQGQFLWVDEYCPEIQLLDRFIQFMLNRSFEFEWRSSKRIHHIEAYREATAQQVKAQLEQHVNVDKSLI